MTESVTVRRGSLYLSQALYKRYFGALDSLILLRRGNDLLILPVRLTAGGGFCAKLRNSAGDRVVHAPEFFRAQGWDDASEHVLGVQWSASRGGLEAEAAFAL